MRVRPSAVSGLFYPADPAELGVVVRRLLHSDRPPPPQPTLKAIIAPHAGYVYSGPTAAAVYRLLEPEAKRIRRVVLIGPSHRVPLAGLAVPEAEAFESPLGAVPVDAEGRKKLLAVPHVQTTDLPHAGEHSLEVHLPFLQTVLVDFTLLPIVVGAASAEEVCRALEAVWGGPETLIVASSDLSHYHEYSAARRIDAATNLAILDYSTRLTGNQACGHVPVNGLLACARNRGLNIELKDLRNSGDTAGDPDRVVGYGAWALYDA